MGARLRRMKAYRPRKRRKAENLNKQMLYDLEHKMSADIGALLVLLEEGNKEQITQALQKAKSDFKKLGPDMQKIAINLGGAIPKCVGDFLNSIDLIIHSEPNWIDEAKVKECFSKTEKLEKALKE